jgi:hypothetical protein
MDDQGATVSARLAERARKLFSQSSEEVQRLAARLEAEVTKAELRTRADLEALGGRLDGLVQRVSQLESRLRGWAADQMGGRGDDDREAEVPGPEGPRAGPPRQPEATAEPNPKVPAKKPRAPGKKAGASGKVAQPNDRATPRSRPRPPGSGSD